MTRFSHVRWRLAAWNLAVLALVLATTVGVTAIAETGARNQALERELRLGAQREVARFSAESDERPEAFAADTADLFTFWIDRRGRVLRNSRDVAVAGLPDQAGLAAALQGREMLSDVSAASEPFRLLSVPVYHEGRVDGAVQVGRSLSDVQAGLRQFLLILLGAGAAGLALAGIGSVFLAERATSPILRALEQQRQFLADASHELRTPAAVVRARSQALARLGDGLPSEAREDVRQLERDAGELSDLVGELLDLARLDAGEGAIALEPVPLAEVVEDLVVQLRPLAQERGVTLSAETTPLWARADLGRLRQVLRALTDNALKHTPPGGSVHLDLTRQVGRARVRVMDTGEGIAPEQLPRVFDRFYRADSARGRGNGSAGGTGLGLAIADQLVRGMHGELRLESQPGKGTTATLLLPMAGGEGPKAGA